ncbi:MAG: hypothetical protein ACREJ2_11275, partial [Planctomycetota bacterium]
PAPAPAPAPAVAAPSIDLIGSAGKVTVAAATLAWHRTFFADPAKLRAWIQKLNAPTADGQSQPIQFYVHTIELGEIAPHAGPGGAALYQDCFVAVELRPLLVGGGFDAAPVLILNRPVFAVEQEYWHACGFAEPVIGNFAFTTLRKIKLQLPQRQRNMLGFLRWLNGDWLEIAPDPAIEKIAPLNSLDYATEADFLAALQALRTRFKAKQPQLKLVPLGANLRDRVAKMYQAQDAEKQ